jgi:signal transduction histidine kinase
MVVNQMNGDIVCQSEPGKGTTISFDIEVKCSEDDHGFSELMNINFNR